MSSELVAAVLTWHGLVEQARALKRARADERCEFEEPPESDTGYAGVEPCWREVGDRNGEPWCEPCQRRQPIHEQYQQAVKARRAAQRKLERVCARNRPTTEASASAPADPK